MSTKNLPLEVRLGFHPFDDALKASDVLDRLDIEYELRYIVDREAWGVLSFYTTRFLWSDWLEFQEEFPDQTVTFSIYPNPSL